MPNNDDLVRETYRLTVENNKMLHKMRRNAFWSRFFSFIIYAALLAAPIWFYMQYLAPVVDRMFKTAQQIQGTGAQAQAQFNSLQDTWKQFEARFGGSSSTSSKQ